jgi:hypothetical protein
MENTIASILLARLIASLAMQLKKIRRVKIRAKAVDSTPLSAQL